MSIQDEILALNMKDCLDDEDKERLSELKRQFEEQYYKENPEALKKIKLRSELLKQAIEARKETPDVSAQLDMIQDKFGKKIEPWTVFTCRECGDKYHLIDGAKCECGKKDSDRRQKQYLGKQIIPGVNDGIK